MCSKGKWSTPVRKRWRKICVFYTINHKNRLKHSPKTCFNRRLQTKNKEGQVCGYIYSPIVCVFYPFQIIIIDFDDWSLYEILMVISSTQEADRYPPSFLLIIKNIVCQVLYSVLFSRVQTVQNVMYSVQMYRMFT